MRSSTLCKHQCHDQILKFTFYDVASVTFSFNVSTYCRLMFLQSSPRWADLIQSFPASFVMSHNCQFIFFLVARDLKVQKRSSSIIYLPLSQKFLLVDIVNFTSAPTVSLKIIFYTWIYCRNGTFDKYASSSYSEKILVPHVSMACKFWIPLNWFLMSYIIS